MATQEIDPLSRTAAHQGSSERQLTIAVDFDRVLAEYEGWTGDEVVGISRLDVLQVLNRQLYAIPRRQQQAAD